MNTPPSLPSYTDDHLARLQMTDLLDLMVGDEDRVPRNLIDECARRGETAAVYLAELLANGDFWKPEPARGRWWLRLHAVMILGLIPSERAGLALVAAMRRMSQEDDHNLQEWFSGSWPWLYQNKPVTVLPALRAVCADRGLDWYIRANATDAVVAGARQQGQEQLEQALDWLAAIAGDEGEDWTMRLSVGNTLLDFPRGRHRPLLDDLAARQAGFGVHFSADDVQCVYETMTDDPEWERHREPWRFYTPAAIEQRQRRWQEEYRDDPDDDEDEDLFMEETAVAYVRAAPKIGRNDPCPCGSGKKYKKCCLNAEALSDFSGADEGDDDENDGNNTGSINMANTATSIYRIKVTLRHIAPPIWRRIEVPADITLGKLHDVLQDTMGWTDSHMHAFRVGRDTYGTPAPDIPDYDVKDERKARLAKVAAAGGAIIYEYDFGDGWEHELKVEKVLTAEPKVRYPRCTAGKRACPPEDCGGPYGYQNLLEILRDPKHEEHEEMLEWAPPDFDPEAFEAEEVSKLLRRIR
jgi:hypothetical protein